ncbi:MAG: ABC transporter permease [Bacillota bacterium]|jgi:hypothetical protein
MSSTGTLLRLSLKNTRHAPGRLAIIVLLLTAALLARSASHLVQASLCEQAAEAVSVGVLPRDFNAIILSHLTFYPPRLLDAYITRGLGVATWHRTDYLAASCETYQGPGGDIWLLRNPQFRETRPSWATHPGVEGWSHWYSALEGRLPEALNEIIIPRPFAELTGLGPGDRLTLLRDTPIPHEETFSITGVYDPAGVGRFYECFLGAADPREAPSFNFVVLKLTASSVAVIRHWGRDPAGGASGIYVYEMPQPRERMVDLARTVYGAQTRAAEVGVGLVGVAVLVVLLVAMVERKREAAIYKMVGMNSVATLTVLAFELLLAVVIAVLLAAPLYWWLASAVIPVTPGTPPMTLAPSFGATLLRTVLVTALGAAYPFALTSVGTPNQLLTGQKIYIFRRKHVLRGWTDDYSR